MRDDVYLIWVGLAVIILVSVTLVVLFSMIERRRRDEMVMLRRELETLKQTVGALCSSSVGVDKRVNRIERQGRDLEERQENIEISQQTGEPPYAKAIRMVHEGADAHCLVEELGLNHGEADLIIMMHGIKRGDQSTG